MTPKSANLSDTLANEILAYLSRQPYMEVAGLISKVQQLFMDGSVTPMKVAKNHKEANESTNS